MHLYSCSEALVRPLYRPLQDTLQLPQAPLYDCYYTVNTHHVMQALYSEKHKPDDE